uniref:Uncharacterized protein n=1 Tax=Panagrolaimus sp. JU765 TaxID=591449 RepID=A0AC34Q4A9_9BILA
MFRGLFLTLLAVSIGLSGSCMLNADLLNTSSKFGEKYGEKDVPNVLEMMSAIIELYCCEKTEFGQKIAAAYLKDEKLEVDTPVRSYTLSRNDAKESDKLVVEDDKVEEVVEQPEVKMPQQAAYLLNAMFSATLALVSLHPQLPKTSAVGFPELSL